MEFQETKVRAHEMRRAQYSQQLHSLLLGPAAARGQLQLGSTGAGFAGSYGVNPGDGFAHNDPYYLKQEEVAAAMSADFRRELAGGCCLMRTYHSTLGSKVVAEAFVLAYPYLPCLRLLVPMIVACKA